MGALQSTAVRKMPKCQQKDSNKAWSKIIPDFLPRAIPGGEQGKAGGKC